jgi:ferredoxin-NADP reductase
MVQPVTLTKKDLLARATMAFHFAKPEGFTFRAGQYGDLTLVDPPETDAEGNTRGFSIEAAPYEPDLVFATRLRDTAFKRVLRTLPVGRAVTLDAPYGDFTLHKTQTTPAVFLTGGIGVTTVHSMIAQATHDRTAHRLTLLHANRTLEDAPLQDAFRQLAKENPHFTFVPVLTKRTPAD